MGKIAHFTRKFRVGIEIGIVVGSSTIPFVTCAQEVRKSGTALDAPIVETVDPNGVDLMSGMLRVTTPGLTGGDGPNAAKFYFTWDGRRWMPDAPSIWVDDDYHVFASFNGQTDEFSGGVKQSDGTYEYTQIRPNIGAKLNCTMGNPVSGKNWLKDCSYTNRDGASVGYTGVWLVNGGFPSWGYLPYAFEPYGNALMGPRSSNIPMNDGSQIWMEYGADYQSRGGIRFWYPNGYFVGKSGLDTHKTVTFSMSSCKPLVCRDGTALQTLTFYTPNLNDSSNTDNSADKSYLRPKNTVQTVTDSAGAVWRYTVNSDGDMTKIQSPTGRVQLLTYDGDHRVKTFNNGSGIWTYSYNFSASSKGAGMTTAIDPSGGVTTVSHARKPGPPTSVTVRNSTSTLSRTTSYTYDGYDRVTYIYHPEQNYERYYYDAYGNVEKIETFPKPNTGASPIVTTAVYGEQCLRGPKCHKPTAITDANGNVTAMTYDAGGRPLTIIQPAVNGQHPKTAFTYSSQLVWYVDLDGNVATKKIGLATEPVYLPILISESHCQTVENCSGTGDEVKDIFGYASGYIVNSSTNNGSMISKSTRNGLGSGLQTFEYVHDLIGNITSEDGPLPGSADTTTYIYNAMRQKIFEIGPMPDVAGSIGRPVKKHWFDAEGREILTQSGVGFATDGSDFVVQNFTRNTYSPETGNLVKVEAGHP